MGKHGQSGGEADADVWGGGVTFGSLFAGIGGLDLGLERAGMECRWQVEWDDYCQQVLAKHWPDVRRYGDVKECGRHNLEPVDLICGGFPCQPVSVAGKRKGDQDERWLWPEFYRIVCELRPRWVLVENVPGLLSVDNGRLMGGILADLAESGYDAEWDCIPAAAVGAPHLRYRVFIVAHAKGQQDSRFCQTVFRRGYGPLTEGATRRCHSSIGADQWAVEPKLGRVADGVPRRVDRLRALGNAVVPQVAEWIGRKIMEVE